MNIKKISLITVFSMLLATSLGVFARRYYRRGPSRRPNAGFSINFGTGQSRRPYIGIGQTRRPYNWYRHRPRSYNWPLNIGLLPYVGPSFSYRNWNEDRIAIRNYRDLQNEMELLESKIKRIERKIKDAESRREKARLEDELFRLEQAQDRLYDIKIRFDRAMR